jgi:hypothetical protein
MRGFLQNDPISSLYIKPLIGSDHGQLQVLYKIYLRVLLIPTKLPLFYEPYMPLKKWFYPKVGSGGSSKKTYLAKSTLSMRKRSGCA